MYLEYSMRLYYTQRTLTPTDAFESRVFVRFLRRLLAIF